MQQPDGTPDVPAQRDPGLGTKEETINNLFTYHAPSAKQQAAYLEIREHAKVLATVIDRNCPASPDRTVAMRQLRECVMTANASIATGGGHYR